jgi:oligopeptidase B
MAPLPRPAAIAATVLTAVATSSVLAASPEPPMAPKHPVEITTHGDVRVDEFAWMRDRENPETISYLEAENAYVESMMAHTEQLQQTLYDEMLGRIKQTDLSVPYRDGPFYYYSRTVEGLAYSIRCRKRGSLDAPEEIWLDENLLAVGREYCRVTSTDIDPEHALLAFALDTTGYETVDVYFRDLRTGEMLPDVIEDTAPWGLTWAADGKTIFYARFDESKRTNRIYRHVLGTDPAEDELVLREDDVKFSIGVRRSRSDEWIFISSGSTTTSEAWCIDARNPGAEPRRIAPRRPGVKFSVVHKRGADGGSFLILTDEDAPNYKLVEAPVATPGPGHWETVIPHDRDVYLQGVSVFANHMVTSERRGGYRALRVIPHDGPAHLIELPETVSVAVPQQNREYDTSTFRFTYSSLVTPTSVFDYDVQTRKRTLLKQTEVLGGYDPAHYESHRLYATAADGTRIPISVVHRKGLEPDGDNPCLLYGYGSYGASMDPWFRSNNVSLLDRGFVYAIAHVRGGAEMGRHWKEDGRMMNKKNTFTDFIACAEHLVDEGWTRPDRLAIRGGSAGGLLIGAVVNMQPDLFAAAHAAVPFVDVVNTMSDASIPLTTGEYEEWGDPKEPAAYAYIRSYSPYDNVRSQDYPDMLITAGLNDPRVHYWEPAKWAARLRDRMTGDSLVLLKTNMGAGHGGSSGRYGRLRELAMQYAFIVDRVGVPSSEIEETAPR